MSDDLLTPKKEQLPTNLRLLLLLEDVARRGIAVRPATVGESLGLPKPTIHRLFQTAESEGFLQRDIDGRSYAPGPRLRQMSMDVMSSERIRTARLAILKSLAEKIGETCNLATPDREGMTYLDRVETKWPLRIQLPIGSRVPFHCTASGKMYLSTLKPSTLDGYLNSAILERHTSRTMVDPGKIRAELIETRKRGYSTDNQEFMEDMVALAVPVLDQHDRLLATLSAHAPTQRQSVESLKSYLNVFVDAARRLTEVHTS